MQKDIVKSWIVDLILKGEELCAKVIAEDYRISDKQFNILKVQAYMQMEEKDNVRHQQC